MYIVVCTTVGDCSPEGTIDADHSDHNVRFQSIPGSVKVRMSRNVETKLAKYAQIWQKTHLSVPNEAVPSPGFYLYGFHIIPLHPKLI